MVFNTAFNKIISYIVEVSFIGGGNQSTRRKPLIWQTLSHNVLSSTPCHERDSNSQTFLILSSMSSFLPVAILISICMPIAFSYISAVFTAILIMHIKIMTLEISFHKRYIVLNVKKEIVVSLYTTGVFPWAGNTYPFWTPSLPISHSLFCV